MTLVFRKTFLERPPRIPLIRGAWSVRDAAVPTDNRRLHAPSITTICITNSRLEHTHEDMIMSACMTSRPHCATGMLTGSKPFVLMQLGGAHCEHLSTSVRSPQRRAAAAGQRAREAMVGYEAHSTGSSPQTDTRTDELWPAPVEAAALPPSASRRGTPRMLPLLSGRLERD